MLISACATAPPAGEGPSAGAFYPHQKQTGKISSMEPGEEMIKEFRLYYDKAPAEVLITVNEA